MLLDYFEETIHAPLKSVEIFFENHDLVSLKLRFVSLTLDDRDVEFTLTVLFKV